MAFTTLAIDQFSGTDDVDIEGRVPDGGGDIAKAVGVWGKNTAYYDYGADDLPVNTVNLVSNKLKQVGGDDFWDSIYTIRSVPGMTQNHWAGVTGRFHATGTGSWFGAALRFSDTAEIGFYVYLENTGFLRIEYQSPTSSRTTISSTAKAVAINTDYRIVVSIVGPVIRVFVDDVEVVCKPMSLYVEGSPGLLIGDVSGTGNDISISKVEVGNGDPYESASGEVLDLQGVVKSVFKDAEAVYGRFKNQWLPVVKAWVRSKGGWQLVADATGAPAVPTCGQKIAGVFRCLIGTSTTVRGPNGGSLAAQTVNVTTNTKTDTTAVYNGAEMILDGAINSVGTSALNKVFAPGALGLGVNVIDKGTLLATGWATPEAPFGCAARGQRYYQKTDDWGYNFITGLPRAEQPLGKRVYFVGAVTASITVGPNTYSIEYDPVDGGMKQLWNTECEDTLDFWGMPESEAFPDFVLGASILPANAAFPGKASGDINSIYIANYLEIMGDGTLDSTRFRYGVICSQKNPALARDILLSNINPGIPTAACESDAEDGDDLDTIIFPGVPNWQSEKEYLYVGAKNSGMVYAMDPSAAGAIDYSFDTGLTVTRGMALNFNAGDILIVAGGGFVKAFAVGTNVELWSTAVGAGTYFVYVQPFSTNVWVSNTDDGTVTILNGSTGAVVDTVTVGTQPRQIVRHAIQNLIYVANQGDDTLSLINPSTFVEEKVIAVLEQPWGLSYDQTNRVVWVGHAVENYLLAS